MAKANSFVVFKQDGTYTMLRTAKDIAEKFDVLIKKGSEYWLALQVESADFDTIYGARASYAYAQINIPHELPPALTTNSTVTAGGAEVVANVWDYIFIKGDGEFELLQEVGTPANIIIRRTEITGSLTEVSFYANTVLDVAELTSDWDDRDLKTYSNLMNL